MAKSILMLAKADILVVALMQRYVPYKGFGRLLQASKSGKWQYSCSEDFD